MRGFGRRLLAVTASMFVGAGAGAAVAGAEPAAPAGCAENPYACKVVAWSAPAVPAIGSGILCFGMVQSAGWTFEGAADLPNGGKTEPHVGYAKVWFQSPELFGRPCDIGVRVVWRNLDTGASGQELAVVKSSWAGTQNAEVYFNPGAGRTTIEIATNSPALPAKVSTVTP